jgi:ArsR family transcriptional regulator, lead/cadmium/zinc/bismuth-responsive transcriptional repressor
VALFAIFWVLTCGSVFYNILANTQLLKDRAMNPNQKNNTDHVCGVKVIHIERVHQARRQAIPDREINRLAQIHRVLSDPTRLKLVMALAGGDMCVCDLAAFVALTDSAVSHHLRRLKDLALVKQRRDGQVLYYSLDDNHVEQLLNVGLEHVRERKGY